MCEACGPSSGEHERVRPGLMRELHEHLDKELGRRGTTVEQLLDPDCYTVRGKVAIWFKDLFRNIGVAFDRA